MLTDCKDSILHCEDFSWHVSPSGVVVNDHAEGERYSMSYKQLEAAVAEVIADEHPPIAADLIMAANIVANATKIGLATFVRNYCEV